MIFRSYHRFEPPCRCFTRGPELKDVIAALTTVRGPAMHPNSQPPIAACGHDTAHTSCLDSRRLASSSDQTGAAQRSLSIEPELKKAQLGVGRERSHSILIRRLAENLQGSRQHMGSPLKRGARHRRYRQAYE